MHGTAVMGQQTDETGECVDVVASCWETMQGLGAWFKTQDIYFNPSLCVQNDADGAGVYLKPDHQVAQDELLCSIPLSAVLSRRTSSLQVDLSAIESHAVRLAAIVCHEVLLAEESRWHMYLRSLPKSVPLLYTWPEEAKSLVQGTELRQYLTFDEDLPTIYEHIVKPALTQQVYPRDRCATFEDFSWAYQMVQSRAFWVDSNHELSMVPLADIFNHSPRPHTQLETDDHLTASASGSATAEMRASRPVIAEDKQIQLYNTYGNLTNAQLILRYGFLVEANPNDRITWSSAQSITSSLGHQWSTTHKTLFHALLQNVDVQEDDEMICRASKTDYPQFFIDADARLSLPLVLLLVLLVHPDQPRPTETPSVSIEQILADLTLRKGTARLIIQLCVLRLAKITQEHSLDEHFDLKDAAEVEGSDPARIMALSIVVEEAVKVQACMVIWQEYIEDIDI